MRYHHLDQAERYQISAHLSAGFTPSMIAQIMQRSGSTISREIARSKGGGDAYCAVQAQRLAEQRALGSRNAKTIDASLWAEVDERLRLQHSPEQIAGKLPLSHEAIYQRVYADKRLGGDLHKNLRCQRKRKKRYASGQQRRGQIIGRRSIDERPASVEQRLRYGHWEADTVLSAANTERAERSARSSAVIVSLVERKCGLSKFKKVPNRKASTVARAIIEMLTPYRHVLKTITYDNGKEFAAHALVDQALGCTSYFADPYCAWQRGTNENTNGLLRQYVPKKRSIDSVSDAELQRIEHLLNTRPRKRLNFDSPLQRMPRKKHPRVALRS